MVEITCVMDAQELTLVCLCVHECVCVFAHVCVDRVTQKEDEVSAVPAESSHSCHQMMLCGSAFIRELFVILFLNRLECEVVTAALLSPARPIISFTGTRKPLCYISRPAGSVRCTPLCSPTFSCLLLSPHKMIFFSSYASPRCFSGLNKTECDSNEFLDVVCSCLCLCMT